MKFDESLRLRGELRIIQIPGEFVRDDRPVDPELLDALIASGRASAKRYSNLIVDNGLSAVSRMLGHGLSFPSVGGQPVSSVADLRVASMRIGTTLNPVAPVITNTDISEVPPSYTIGFIAVYYPGLTSVTFAGVVPQAVTALNGQALTEEGLFLENGAMIAHVTFLPEVKLPTHAVQLEHTFTITRG